MKWLNFVFVVLFNIIIIYLIMVFNEANENDLDQEAVIGLEMPGRSAP